MSWLAGRLRGFLVIVAAITADGLACLCLAGAGVGVVDASATTSPSADPTAQFVLANPGAGYSVTFEGERDAPTFTPDPANAADALVTPGGHAPPDGGIEPYERTWRDAAGSNRVDDLLVRFPTPAAATAFLAAVRGSLNSAAIVNSGALDSVRGGQQAIYFASAPEAGIGQTVTLHVGSYVDVLSFFSAGSGNPAPITSAAVARVAVAQYAALGPMQAEARVATPPPKTGTSASGVVWAVVAVVVLASTLAVPLVLRRRTRDAVGRDEQPAKR